MKFSLPTLMVMAILPCAAGAQGPCSGIIDPASARQTVSQSFRAMGLSIVHWQWAAKMRQEGIRRDVSDLGMKVNRAGLPDMAKVSDRDQAAKALKEKTQVIQSIVVDIYDVSDKLQCEKDFGGLPTTDPLYKDGQKAIDEFVRLVKSLCDMANSKGT